ncbi:hypothetical protein [Frankia sp. CiP3]|uniref:hypothetical protein n=1 Tax=Frankia sp. CiP3 TaxID=2880971 RepID=UPI001EF59881|nr:hypothetical protein [Frankia sp. CiP3]
MSIEWAEAAFRKVPRKERVIEFDANFVYMVAYIVFSVIVDFLTGRTVLLSVARRELGEAWSS